MQERWLSPEGKEDRALQCASADLRPEPETPPKPVCGTEAEGPQTVVGGAGGAVRPAEAREGGATKQRTWTFSKNREQGNDSFRRKPKQLHCPDRPPGALGTASCQPSSLTGVQGTHTPRLSRLSTKRTPEPPAHLGSAQGLPPSAFCPCLPEAQGLRPGPGLPTGQGSTRYTQMLRKCAPDKAVSKPASMAGR